MTWTIRSSASLNTRWLPTGGFNRCACSSIQREKLNGASGMGRTILLCPRHEDRRRRQLRPDRPDAQADRAAIPADRKITRLNSSHSQISYAVFCLKKKKKISYSIVHQDT